MTNNRTASAVDILAKCFASRSLAPILGAGLTNERATVAMIFSLSRFRMKGDDDSLFVAMDKEHSLLVYFNNDDTVKRTVFRTPVSENVDATAP